LVLCIFQKKSTLAFANLQPIELTQHRPTNPFFSHVHTHFDLTSHNTFGLSAHAQHYAPCLSEADLLAAIASGIRPIRVLGGGSNVLLTRDVDGLLLHNLMTGITIREQHRDHALVAVAGGHNWHQLVRWAVAHDLGGLENLSLIPGTVGASPVQNIGAYGVELKDVFVELTAIDLHTGEKRVFDRTACQFGYRDSIFKREAKGRFCIVEVLLRLSTSGHHRLNVSYGDLQKTLADMGVTDAHRSNIGQVSEAVVRIRSSKLPDPAQIGNCGSFFKNPEQDRNVLERIRAEYPHAPAYDLPDGRVKIPAGWLIEQCGWKGKRVGNAGCYEKQALVLVNHGGATGSEVRQLAQDIIDSVAQKFGVPLEPEVNVW
jgi:UDP-N-acetylmuramate dehydrogenase